MGRGKCCPSPSLKQRERERETKGLLHSGIYGIYISTRTQPRPSFDRATSESRDFAKKFEKDSQKEDHHADRSFMATREERSPKLFAHFIGTFRASRLLAKPTLFGWASILIPQIRYDESRSPRRRPRNKATRSHGLVQEFPGRKTTPNWKGKKSGPQQETVRLGATCTV